jgi:hypothetical protein
MGQHVYPSKAASVDWRVYHQDSGTMCFLIKCNMHLYVLIRRIYEFEGLIYLYILV